MIDTFALFKIVLMKAKNGKVLAFCFLAASAPAQENFIADWFGRR